MRSSLAIIVAAASSLIAVTETAYAGFATPGPVAAIGAPALLVIGGAFLAVRYLRARHK